MDMDLGRKNKNGDRFFQRPFLGIAAGTHWKILLESDAMVACHTLNRRECINIIGIAVLCVEFLQFFFQA